MSKSVWQEKISLPQFNRAEGDMKTDVLIIGGGICGLLCAYRLQEAGIGYILVEKNRIASGVTKNTTAKITSQHGLIYADIIKNSGKETAQKYLQANEAAIRDFRRIWKACETQDAYTYSISDRKKIEEEVSAVRALGHPADFIENTELPFPVSGAIRLKGQAMFHPLDFISYIAKSLHIYENTEVVELTPSYAVTSLGKIKAKCTLVTTHFPFLNKHGSYFLKLYQHRSYVTAAENATKLSGMYVDENDKGLSFRNYDNLLLVGSGGHRTGKKSSAWREGEAFLKKYYPKARITHTWATQDCMSLDKIPYIGLYGNTPGLYVATGFNKWGMTASMVAANLLCDLVSGKKNEYEDVFSPRRSILKPQLLVNSFESVTNLLRPTKPRCPHMGCALSWNKHEHSWDCSCHGSRFSKDGKLLNNPATGDIKKP